MNHNYRAIPLAIISFLFLGNGWIYAQTYLHPTTGLQNTYAGACEVNGCGGTYVDNGGTGGNYSNNINLTYRTFCPDQPNQCLRLTFTSFNLEPADLLFCGGCCDYLSIGNGPTQNSPTLWQGCGSTSPPVITSTDPSGCLTVRFYSDFVTTAAGWTANITCVPCSGGPSATLNTDCVNAQFVCDNLQSISANSQGPGLTSETCNSGCVVSENYSNWYILNVTAAGPFDLTINPTPFTADYDFALYGPVVGGCGNLGSPIRCSYAANTGPTGMRPTSFDFSEDVLGDGWVNSANLSVGTYYLMVNQWSYEPNSKFQLDFNQYSGTALIGLPAPVLSANTPVCSNKPLQLTANAVSGATYSWSGPGGWTSTQQNPTRNPPVAGTYSMNYTVNGCSSPSSTVNVAVNTAPAPIINPASATICPGQSATLTASGGTGYVWSNASVTSSITVSPASTTTYVVTVTANGCTASTSATVTVGNNLTPAINPSTAAICAGSSITLTASGGTIYNWSNSSTTASITVSPLTTTTYTVTVGDGSSCTGTTSRTVTVNPNPTASILPANVNICNGVSTTLTASGGGTYIWSNSSTAASITVSPSATTIYDVTVTDGNNCTATDSRQVTVFTNPTATVTPASQAICSGDVAIISAGGGNAFIWSNSATTQNINVTPVSSTTYTVTVSDANSCTGTASGTVNVNATPLVTVTPSSTDICNGMSTTLTASGGLTYSWSNSATANAITVSPVTTTAYSVTATDANSCSGTASGTVNVNVNPVASILPATAQICAGGSISLTASGGTSFLWSTSETTATISVSPASNMTYSVTVMDGNSCSASASRSVTVNPYPTASITPSALSICEGNNATLAASGGNIFMWSNSATTASITVNPSATTIYSVTVTNSNSCSAVSSATVTVNSNPVVAVIPASISICNGSSATLSTSGGSSYLWSNSATTSSITVSPLSATTYTVTVTNANLCSATGTASVNIFPNTVAAITPASVSICNGNSTSLVASGGATYLWSTSETATAINVNPGATSSYAVTVTDAHSCTASTSALVTVNANPVATITPNPAEICEGENLDLTSSGGTSYNWSTSATSGTINVAPLSSTTYDVTVTDLNNCTATASRTVNVHANPMVSVTPANSNICSGQNLTLNASGANTYQWSTTATGSGITVTPFNSTTYSVTGMDGNQCSGTATATVSITQSITLSQSVTDVSCNGGNNGTIDISVSGGQPPLTYTWSNAATTEDISGVAQGSYSITVGDAIGCGTSMTAVVNEPSAITVTESHQDASCNGNNDGSITVSVAGGAPGYNFSWNDAVTGQNRNGLVAGNYSVTVTDNNSCTASVTGITISEPAAINVTVTSSNISCNGNNDGSITTMVSGGTQPYSFSWNDAGTTQNRNGLAAGNYDVTVSDVNSCTTTASAIIMAPSGMSVTFVQDNPECPQNGNDGSILLTVNGGSLPIGYNWSNGNTTANNVSLAPGNYLVTVTDANGCSYSNQFVLDYKYDFSVDASPSVGIEYGESTQLSYTVTGTVGNHHPSWSPAESLDCVTCEKPNATPGVTTLYTITVMNDEGCAGSDTVTVFVEQNYTISVPNAFSPNGDGYNETFQIYGNLETLESFRITIFDRWGGKIFESTDPYFKWDGTYKGKDLLPGVYVYFTRSLFSDDSQDKLQKGSVTLIR